MKIFLVLHHEIMGTADDLRADDVVFFTCSSFQRALDLIKSCRVDAWSWWEIQTADLDSRDWPEHVGYYGLRREAVETTLPEMRRTVPEGASGVGDRGALDAAQHPPWNGADMNLEPRLLDILKIIAANDGAFSWYQLDLTLSQRTREPTDPHPANGLMAALRELERLGLIASATGHNPGQPIYSVTPIGRDLLSSGTSEPGPT